MTAKELAEILLQNPDKKVHFATGICRNTGSLPVETVEVFNSNILLDCR